MDWLKPGLRIETTVALLSLLFTGCGPRSPAPATSPESPAAPASQPMQLVLRDLRTGETRQLMEIQPDGSVTEAQGFGECVASIRDGRVVKRSGEPLLERGADGALLERGADGALTATQGNARLLENGELHRDGGYSATINDAGEIQETPRSEDFVVRFAGYTPARRQTAMLAFASWGTWLSGCVALAVVAGLSMAYGQEANPDGGPMESPDAQALCGCTFVQEMFRDQDASPPAP